MIIRSAVLEGTVAEADRAGFDAHIADPLAELRVRTADFVWLTGRLLAVAERHCKGRLVSLLEGGYDLDALAEASAAHVRTLMHG